eukprot:TRINITY_DN13513_c0_g1_i1.p1 TRINITY_DN13513_c0_g1~~TRINITY_DN13513_c0_g1_i1.p1  ORF type:complete len:188 (+),score=60.31 TRINITY_DN13513_c0_g1_i1:22-585(+)
MSGKQHAKAKGGYNSKQPVYEENIPKFLRPFMDKNKDDITHKSAALDRSDIPELEDEQPLVVEADAELMAEYKKQQELKKVAEQKQQEERRKNEELKMRAKVISEAKVPLTEETAHVFHTKRDKTNTNQSSSKRGADRGRESSLAKKRQKLMPILDDDDEDLKTAKPTPQKRAMPKLSFADDEEDSE